MLKEKHYYVYIATNHPRHTVLYTGITNGLIKRWRQHKEKWNKNSFTAKYNVNKIIYFEIYGDINEAISEEKQLKAGSRKKKLSLINKVNPEWKDLVDMIINNDIEMDKIIEKVEYIILDKDKK